VLHNDGAVAKAGSGEAKFAKGMTALVRAASHQNWGEVRNLIPSGADLVVADGQGLTALHYTAFYYTAFYGSAELARTMIEHGQAGLVLGEAHVGDGGETSLLLACARGHLDVVELLIKAGAEEHHLKTNKDGLSYLYFACHEGHLAIEKALIQAGEDVTKQDGGSCLSIAGQGGHVQIDTALIKAG
jgi:ankyrin repeat protein